MNNLKKYKDEEIIEMLKKGTITRADFLDSGICPTCFDREHNNIIYGNDSPRMIYEDKDLECFLVENPRAIGHTVIATKKHYKDMMELDDDICMKVFLFAKKVMNIIKKVYQCESVYECTMCDGAMNHFHLQLIPRYSYEKRGSKNFVKERKEYKEDQDKIEQLRKLLEK